MLTQHLTTPTFLDLRELNVSSHNNIIVFKPSSTLISTMRTVGALFATITFYALFQVHKFKRNMHVYLNRLVCLTIF